MRTVRRNKTPLLYSSYLSQADIYDFYEDEEGNRYPIPTGEKEPVYSTPEEIDANISKSGGEAEAMEYGFSVADYQAVLLFSKGSYPLKEGSLVWENSPVEYQYDGEEIEVDDGNGGTVKTKAPVPISADYTVIKISDSLNYTKAILKATNK